MEFKVDGFFGWLYQNNANNGNIIETCSPEEFSAVKDLKRAELKKALGIDRMEAINHPWSVEKLGNQQEEEYAIESLSMEILPFLKMPVYIVKPAANTRRSSDGSIKAVLYCHGHGKGGCRDCFDIREPKAYHKNIPLTLAKRGYTVFMFEPAGFGDFIMESYKQPEERGCYSISTQLLMYGMTALGLRIFQAAKLTDYMLEKYKINDFATLGISGGGTVCSLYAAIDDRMKANVISSYTNMFKDSIMAMHHCIDNFVPGIFSIGEMPHVISLAFPKPMYLCGGKNDPIYPAHALEKSIGIIKKIYGKSNMADKVEAEIFDGGHEFSEEFINWLDKIL